MLSGINAVCAVCFSGHRPERLPGQGNYDNEETQKLAVILQNQIEGAVQRGKHIFLHGAMAGWDIFAAEQVIKLKKQNPSIRLITVAPYKTQFFSSAKCWTPDWIGRASEVWYRSEIIINLADGYRAGIYHERNRVLVDNSSELVAYWDGGKGGTAYTVQYARRKKLTVHNLYTE
jgi:uncharacterized phage-like protein YoqJ